MPHLFSTEGTHAIKDLLGGKILLALDFDGTLAPIMAKPEQARTPLAISRVLTDLGKYLTIAIITGRSVTDVTDRLGFEPQYIVGNHGIEGIPNTEQTQTLGIIEQWSALIDKSFRPELEAAGVSIENKRHSLSLHYRLARDRHEALNIIQATIAKLSPPVRILDGKCVVNLLPQSTPDKFDAITKISQLIGCDSVIFVGDDVTDDVVFEKAPPQWLTIRIEALEHHKARFHLNHQNEMAIFLQRFLLEFKPDMEA
jgi:trehalose 6-phosphate phosphatase